MSGRGRHRRGIFPRFSVPEDVERELRAHLEMREEELRARGWDAAEARAEARRLFGDVEAVERDCVRISERRERAVERGRLMGELGQDVRYALRTLVKAPVFAAVALVTLGLGIGANTAVFSVVNGVLLRPLPFEDPDELVFVSERSRRGGSMSAAWANFRDWRAASGSFEGLAAYSSGTTTVLGGEEPAWATVAFVSEDFWRVFGVAPSAGRLLLPDDHVEGAAPAVVVSRAFARSVLGAEDPVGRTVEAFGSRAQVVGVAPAGFDYPGDVQVWAPTPPQGESRTAHNWSVVGRLRDGVGVDAAARELDVLMARIAATAPADEPSEYLAVGAVTAPLQARIVGDAGRPLLILLGAAGGAAFCLRAPGALGLLLPTLVYFAASGALIAGMSRYRIAIEPLLIMLAAGFLSGSERPWRGLLRATVCTGGWALLALLWILNGAEIFEMVRSVW